MFEVNISFGWAGHVSCWVILHLNLNRSNKVHPEFCLKSNLKTISALTVFAFHLVGNNTWIIFLVEGANGENIWEFHKNHFCSFGFSAFDPICFSYHLDYLSYNQTVCCKIWPENCWNIGMKDPGGYDALHFDIDTDMPYYGWIYIKPYQVQWVSWMQWQGRLKAGLVYLVWSGLVELVENVELVWIWSECFVDGR